MEQSELNILRQLIRDQRWAALATLRKDEPYCTMVAYACAADLSALTLHLSTLAPHTQRLLKEPNISIGISEPDCQTEDPQTLARVTLNGKIVRIEREDENYQTLKQRYLERLPNAEALFNFADFSLFEFIPEKVRFVGGFARAYSVDPKLLLGPE